MDTKPSFPDRLYGALLRLLPCDFRREFGIRIALGAAPRDIVSAALIACAVPAYRAARIDPQTALRCD